MLINADSKKFLLSIRFSLRNSETKYQISLHLVKRHLCTVKFEDISSFCNVYTFVSTGKKTVKEIISYVVKMD